MLLFIVFLLDHFKQVNLNIQKIAILFFQLCI